MERIVVLGGGESGVGSAILALKKGFETFLSDNGHISDKYRGILEEYGIEYEDGGHTPEKILNASLIIKSPGIPNNAPLVKEALDAGIQVISEIEFAGRYDRSKKICITGSNGKTTTTSLIYHILRKAGYNVGLGGNIGTSYARGVAESNYEYYVLELSSFQLDGMFDYKADVAIIMNITPDHLDRYDFIMDNYTNSKFRITRNLDAGCSFIYCADDPVTMEQMGKRAFSAMLKPFSREKEMQNGAWMNERSELVSNGFSIPVSEILLEGKHNMYNCMAAILAARAVGVNDDVIKDSLREFGGVEHRMEKCGIVNGVQYINDSKATNVDSAWYALDAMKTPVVWIAGGKDKGNDYEPLFGFVKDKVHTLICMGLHNEKLHDNFGDKVNNMVDALSAQEAVKLAAEYAKAGDTVLLSPCCASFDLFKSYEDRGRQFKAAVEQLQNNLK
ncbi:MAG: UDP-N-acetylmuramoyl-L-alanine--D-glutamate ligase [Bacteroidales bacterium]|nr:UDP-N-acetylmuramoyl-L-alanine--D-glutamate ligase [Bacteroidales bacterium]